MRNTLDFLAMAVTALAISWATVDLYGRATDPHSRQHRSRGNHTDTVRWQLAAPKATGEGALTCFAPHASPSIALASPSFPATSMAGHSTQEGPHEDLGSFPGILPRHSPINPPKEVGHGPVTAYTPHLQTEQIVTRHTARATSQEVSPPTGRIKRPSVTPNPMHTRSAAALAGRSGPCEITTYGTEYRPGGRFNRYGKAGTSSGARYNYKALTCAVNRVKGRPALPYGTWIKVKFGKNSVICKITDTGGHKPRGAKIWFDLSCASMAELMAKPLNPQRAYNDRFVATFEVVKTPVSVAVTARRKR